MVDAVIVSTAHTPVGKAFRGGLADTDGGTIAAQRIRGGEGDVYIAGGLDSVSLVFGPPRRRRITPHLGCLNTSLRCICQ